VLTIAAPIRRVVKISAAGAALLRDSDDEGCGSAWKIDPYLGVIGVQK
jgi:hypothetical protein